METSLLTFNFHGDDLALIHDGPDLWIVVKRVAEALGIDEEPQRKKLARKSWAVTSMKEATGPDGKKYKMFCVHLDSLPMWLATLDAERVKLAIRPKVERYQLDCAKTLRDKFVDPQPHALPIPSPEPALVARVAQLEASNAQILAAFATLPAALAQAVEGAVERAVKAIVPVLPPAPDVSCIGAHGKRHIMAAMAFYGRLMAGPASHEGLTARQWANKGEQDLRGKLNFGGSGARWEFFPMSRFGEVQGAIDVMQTTARQVAGDRMKSAQLPLTG